MAELADATDLKSVSYKGVRVRSPVVPPEMIDKRKNKIKFLRYSDIGEMARLLDHESNRFFKDWAFAVWPKDKQWIDAPIDSKKLRTLKGEGWNWFVIHKSRINHWNTIEKKLYYRLWARDSSNGIFKLKKIKKDQMQIVRSLL